MTYNGALLRSSPRTPARALESRWAPPHSRIDSTRRLRRPRPHYTSSARRRLLFGAVSGGRETPVPAALPTASKNTAAQTWTRRLSSATADPRRRAPRRAGPSPDAGSPARRQNQEHGAGSSREELRQWRGPVPRVKQRSRSEPTRDAPRCRSEVKVAAEGWRLSAALAVGVERRTREAPAGNTRGRSGTNPFLCRHRRTSTYIRAHRMTARSRKRPRRA
jgi:hypothetical protein